MTSGSKLSHLADVQRAEIFWPVEVRSISRPPVRTSRALNSFAVACIEVSTLPLGAGASRATLDGVSFTTTLSTGELMMRPSRLTLYTQTPLTCATSTIFRSRLR